MTKITLAVVASCTVVVAGWGALIIFKKNPVDPDEPVKTILAGSSVTRSTARQDRPLVRGSFQPNSSERPATPPQRRTVEDDVQEMIASDGPAATAAALTEDAASFQASPARQRRAVEALASSWSQTDAPAASAWLLSKTGDNGAAEGEIEPELWEAAVSGYIEGVVEHDAETAANLANLLVPQRSLPAPNPNNRIAPEERTDTVADILREVLERPKTTPTLVPEVPGIEAEQVATVTPTGTEADPDTPTAEPGEGFSEEERRIAFPADPGFPGDPDYIIRLRKQPLPLPQTADGG